jgi:hypothetical protein
MDIVKNKNDEHMPCNFERDRPTVQGGRGRRRETEER